MKIYKAILLTILCVTLGIFWGIEIWSALTKHWGLFLRWFHNTQGNYYPWYIWFASGAIIFPLMNRFFVKNMEMTKTFTHELTHTITGLLLFRRIHSFHAEEAGSGVVRSSGSEKTLFLTALAPYCFPIYTFPLLMLRSVVATPFLPIIDIFIGFSIGLHVVCIAEQTRSYQTDISQFPLWFSYCYIASVWLFDLSIILLSYLPKQNVFLAFKSIAVDLWNFLVNIVTFIVS